MTPERYKQVGKLFHDALAFAPAERATFLDDQCADDTELRREVESLLASHDQSPTFIAKPAIAMAAELLVDNDADEFIGKPVGRYVVRSLLGIGGMGRVYLAEDLELGRRVALKLLLKQLTHDQTQLQRFRQEARAASALNHPNILTVYEIGRTDDAAFIATEFIDGVTLRQYLRLHRLKLVEVLDIASQVASALVAAHAAGIVHRDIKPENIMIATGEEAARNVKLIDWTVSWSRPLAAVKLQVLLARMVSIPLPVSTGVPSVTEPSALIVTCRLPTPPPGARSAMATPRPT